MDQNSVFRPLSNFYQSPTESLDLLRNPLGKYQQFNTSTSVSTQPTTSNQYNQPIGPVQTSSGYNVTVPDVIPSKSYDSSAMSEDVFQKRNQLEQTSLLLQNAKTTLAGLQQYLTGGQAASQGTDLFSDPQAFLQQSFNQNPSDAAALRQKLLNDISKRTNSFYQNYNDTVDSAYANAGVTQAGERLDEIQGETADRQVRQRQDVRGIQSSADARGYTQSGIDDNVNSVNVIANQELADLAIQEVAATGSYNRALEIARTELEDKVMGFSAEIAAKQSQLEELKPILEGEDKKLAEQQSIALSLLETQMKTAAEDQLTIQEIGMEVIRNGAPEGIVRSIMDAQSPEEAIQYATGWLGRVDRLNTMSLIADRSSGSTPSPKLGTEQLNRFGLLGEIATNTLPKAVGDRTLSTYLSLLEAGNYDLAYAQLASAVSEDLTAETKKRFDASRGEYQILGSLRESLLKFQAAGGDTNIFRGTAQEVANKLGVIATDPAFVEISTELTRNFQKYRQEMTGAAFGVGESADYEKVNPRSKATIELNIATIDGAMNALENQVTGVVESRLPGSNDLYQLATGEMVSSSNESELSDDEAYQLYLKQFSQDQ